MQSNELDILLTRVHQGQTEAYEEVVAAFQQPVWKIAVSMLRDNAAAENLVQQTFVNAYFQLHQFKRGSDFGVWIKAIVRNVVREEMRKQMRSGSHMREYHQYLVARLDNPSNDDSEREQQAEALRRCREKLPSQWARAIELRYDLGHSFEELAAELGRTLEATRQHLNRIRIELKNCMLRGASKS